jgi:AraC-like DNA-binding protein
LIENLENIAGGSFEIYNENNELIVIKLDNPEDAPTILPKNIIRELVHLYICLEGEISVEITEQHYSFPLKEDTSTLIFIKDFTPKLKFHMQPFTKAIGVYISVDRLHALFSQDTAQLPVFSSIGLGKRIIESGLNTAGVREVASQLFAKDLTETYKSIYVKGKLLELLGTYFYAADKGKEEQCPYIANEESAAKIKKAKTIMISNLTETPSLNDLAKMVGLNVKALKEGFKELYGKPVINYLFHYRMEEAKKLLESGTNNVSEIAPLVGYSSSSHFITAFKRKYGVTPKQFLR